MAVQAEQACLPQPLLRHLLRVKRIEYLRIGQKMPFPVRFNQSDTGASCLPAPYCQRTDIDMPFVQPAPKERAIWIIPYDRDKRGFHTERRRVTGYIAGIPTWQHLYRVYRRCVQRQRLFGHRFDDDIAH